MMRRALLLALFASFAFAPPVLGAHTYNRSEELVRDLVREHRGYISTTPTLSHEARDRAFEIEAEYLRTGAISHAGAFDEVDGCWWLGEIIAYTKGYTDYVASAEWVVNSWHESPTHDSVMHSTTYTRFGVGSVIEGDVRFYVVVFGKPC